MEQQQQVISIRPAEQEIGPSFQPSVLSCPSNVYIQEVQAQTHNENRVSWTWRSPSSGLVCSPLAYARFQVKIASTVHRLTKEDLVGGLFGTIASKPQDRQTQVATGTFTDRKCRPLLCFGEGNAVQNAIENISIGINGSVWSELNGHLYSRSLTRCFEPEEVQQRIYSTCGGAPLAFDDKPLSGHVMSLPDSLVLAGAAVNITAAAVPDHGFVPVEGRTMDSGLAQRQKNLADQIVKHEQTVHANEFNLNSITVEVRYPINGSVFNSAWGQSGLARSDPRLRMALAIPNLNQGQITINFKNLLKTVIRRLGRPSAFGAANISTGTCPMDADDITVTYDNDFIPRLELTYIRLPSFRAYPQSSALSVYRRDCRRSASAETGKALFPAGFFDSPSDMKGLRCSTVASGKSAFGFMRPLKAYAANDDTLEAIAEWNGIQFPQPPSKLFIVMQKSSDVYSLKNPLNTGVNNISISAAAGTLRNWVAATEQGQPQFTNSAAAQAHLTKITATATQDAQRRLYTAMYCMDRYIAQNQASNAAIMQVEIQIQSAVGSWSFVSDKQPYLRDRDRLYRRHTQNCCDGYIKAGRGAWQDRASCALLSCSDFLLGLSTGPGVVFPIIIDARVKFANRSAVASGALFSTGKTKGMNVYEDIMVGQPVMVGLFDNQILSLSSSSAVLSAQAFSQSTYAAAVSQRQ